MSKRKISLGRLAAWWAMRSQKRRRHRVVVDLPPLPEVVLSNGSYSANASAGFDAGFDIAVDLKTWAAAELEIWFNLTDTGYVLLDVVSSDSVHYVHADVAQGEATLVYKARYRSGDVMGAFSNEVVIDISF